MLFALALLTMQQTAPTVVWDQPAPVTAEAATDTPVLPTSTLPDSTLPDWALADPFAYERAHCSAMVRGDTPLEACQAEARAQLAAALGAAMPDALKPVGMPDDCRMAREAGGGSAYAQQCGPQQRAGAAPTPPSEQDCRPRPARGGGFTSECRPTPGQEGEGLKLRLWGDD